MAGTSSRLSTGRSQEPGEGHLERARGLVSILIAAALRARGRQPWVSPGSATDLCVCLCLWCDPVRTSAWVPIPSLCAAGKVHGSLARAGKVRGQTPKVQKQDKKKQPKGRAMKRIKYNRRFVNVGEAPCRDVAGCGLAACCLRHQLHQL